MSKFRRDEREERTRLGLQSFVVCARQLKHCTWGRRTAVQGERAAGVCVCWRTTSPEMMRRPLVGSDIMLDPWWSLPAPSEGFG